MRTSSAKAKGRRLATEVQALLYKYAPELKPGDIQVTSSGACGEDVLLSPAARDAYPLVIECKNKESLNIWQALTQAESHIEPEVKRITQGPVVTWIELGIRTPAVFFRRNRSRMYVALPAEDFIKLIR